MDLDQLPRAEPGTALLLDAAGTLLQPIEPVAETYAAYADAYGTPVSVAEVAKRLPVAMIEADPLRRGTADWRRYWAQVVARSTGSDDPELLDELIVHFAAPAAWRVAAGAETCCERVRAQGMKVMVVSNWDMHLRPLLAGLGVRQWIDGVVVSGEEGIDKPDPAMWERACARLGVAPNRAVHVGDDPFADRAGARAAGCAALLIDHDVASFDALAQLLLR